MYHSKETPSLIDIKFKPYSLRSESEGKSAESVGREVYVMSTYDSMKKPSSLNGLFLRTESVLFTVEISRSQFWFGESNNHKVSV